MSAVPESKLTLLVDAADARQVPAGMTSSSQALQAAMDKVHQQLAAPTQAQDAEESRSVGASQSELLQQFLLQQQQQQQQQQQRQGGLTNVLPSSQSTMIQRQAAALGLQQHQQLQALQSLQAQQQARVLAQAAAQQQAQQQAHAMYVAAQLQGQLNQNNALQAAVAAAQQQQAQQLGSLRGTLTDSGAGAGTTTTEASSAASSLSLAAAPTSELEQKLQLLQQQQKALALQQQQQSGASAVVGHGMTGLQGLSSDSSMLLAKADATDPTAVKTEAGPATGDEDGKGKDELPTAAPGSVVAPCRARGMPMDHNFKNAYFVIPENTEHGEELHCSYKACRESGTKFRYCLHCKVPVAKRNFRNRHRHGVPGGEGGSDSSSGEEDACSDEENNVAKGVKKVASAQAKAPQKSDSALKGLKPVNMKSEMGKIIIMSPDGKASQQDWKKKKSKVEKMPCRARGMPMGHNIKTAYFVIPKTIAHGDELTCSYPACREAGPKFRYCLHCRVPVAKRNFRNRHKHGVIGSSVLEGDDDGKDDDAREECSEEEETATPVTTIVKLKGSDDTNLPTAADRLVGSDQTKEEPFHGIAEDHGRSQKMAVARPSTEDMLSCGSLISSSQGQVSPPPKSASSLGGEPKVTEQGVDATVRAAAPVDAPAKKDSLKHKDEMPASSPRTVTVKSNHPKITETRIHRWVNLLKTRPSADDSNGMALWMLNVMNMSDLDRALEGGERPPSSLPPTDAVVEASRKGSSENDPVMGRVINTEGASAESGSGSSFKAWKLRKRNAHELYETSSDSSSDSDLEKRRKFQV